MAMISCNFWRDEVGNKVLYFEEGSTLAEVFRSNALTLQDNMQYHGHKSGTLLPTSKVVDGDTITVEKHKKNA